MGTTRMKDGRWFVFGVFFAMLLGMNQSLYISGSRLAMKVNADGLVACRDDDIKKQVTWTKQDGTVLTATSRPTVRHGPLVGWYILFKNAQSSESGTYMCSLGNEVKSVNVYIEEPLQLYADATQYGEEGEEGLIQCDGTGGTLTFYHGNTVVTDNFHYQRVKEGLKIKNVTTNDSGLYTCRIDSDEIWDMKERTITFIVQHKQPTLFDSEVVKYGRLNETMELECTMETEPAPTFKWYRHSSERGKEEWEDIINEGTYKSVAVIEINSDRDFDFDYICEAKNKFRTEVILFSLVKSEKSVPAEPPNIVDVGSEKIQLRLDVVNKTNAIVQNGMEPKGFYVEYRPKTEAGNWTWRQFDDVNNGTYELDGLQPETEYKIRVATWNVAGPGDFTSILEVQTTSGVGLFLASSPGSYVLVNFLVVFFNSRRFLW